MRSCKLKTSEMFLSHNLIVPVSIVNFINVNIQVTISKGWMCLDEVRMSLVSNETVRCSLFFGGPWELSRKEARKAGQVDCEEGAS